jgi:hypothetical protein
MKVRVVNDNTYPYSEKFKGADINIDPGKYVEMERDEAVLFLGQFNSIERDVDGRPHPKSYKKLRIEKIPEKTAEKSK